LAGGKEGITRIRGKWKMLEIQGIDEPVRALPTYHPAYLLRQPSAKRAAWADLLTLRQECVKSCNSNVSAMQKSPAITKS